MTISSIKKGKNNNPNKSSLSSNVNWWSLKYQRGGKFGRQQAFTPDLSKHVLNLRPGLVPLKQTTPTNETVSKFEQRESWAINFLKPGKNYIIVPWRRLELRFPLLQELTALFLLELVYFFIYLIFRAVALFYYFLYVRLKGIGKSIAEDLVYYFELNYRVISRLFKPWQWFRESEPLGVFFTVPRLRQMVIFLLIAILLILPLKWITWQQDFSFRKSQLLTFASAALNQFSQASSKLIEGEFDQAEDDFKEVTNLVINAQEALGNINAGLAALLTRLPGRSQQLVAAQQLLQAGKELAESGSIISRTMSELDSSPVENILEMDLNIKILILQRGIAEIQPKIRQALNLLKSVSELELPQGVDVEVVSLASSLQKLEGGLTQVLSLPNIVSQIIPTSGNKNYLLLFQNYSELRPAGGFLGSLAFIETTNGKINKIDIPGGGPYDFQGQLAVLLEPPQPLKLVNPLWQLQDANWFFDFPTSAQKVAWFVTESGGPTVDGVIAINPDVIINLLKLVGPIDLPAYNKHITAENFIRETQEAVDLEFDRVTNRPKQFIADLAPILLERIINLKPTDQITALTLINQGLMQKSIQLYFNDPNIQQRIIEAGWGGEIKSTIADYLAIVRANIGGGKTDLVINERAQHLVKLFDNGDLQVRVDFTRSHQGDPDDIFYRRRNVSWLKFYVPLGSKLIQAEGFSHIPEEQFRSSPSQTVPDDDFKKSHKLIAVDKSSGTEISEEFNKTVFTNWLVLEPGETKTVSIIYELPFGLATIAKWQDLRQYDVLFQRQSGTKPIDFTSTFELPEGWRLRWQEASAELKLTPVGLSLFSDWQQDQFYGLILERPSRP